MGKAATIVKLLSSPMDDDYKLGWELLMNEYYYDYILEYMSEIVNYNRLSYKKDREGSLFWGPLKLKSKRQL